MSARPLFRAALVLGLAVVAITERHLARFGRSVVRWRVDSAWSQPLAGRAMHLWVTRGEKGGARLVVHGLESLSVWTAEGRRLAQGTIPFGTDAAIGDFTGDGVDEIAVASESLPPDAPVSIQVVDGDLDPVSPNIGVLEGLEVPASVAIAPMRESPQVVAADFRGCLVSLVPPEMVWEHCFPNASVGGDPYAVRHLAYVDTGGRRLIVAGRATGEVAALDAEGTVAWSYRLREPLRELQVLDLQAPPRLVFAGGTAGAFALLDAGTGEVRGTGTLPGMVMVARAAIWGADRRPAVAVGGLAQPSLRGRSGYVVVLGRDGLRRATFPLEGQVMDLVAVDLDGDAREEIVAVTGAYRMIALPDTGAVLFERRVEEPSETKLGVLVSGSETRLLVAAGARLESLQPSRSEAPWWYAPLAAGSAVALVLALALGGLATLRYPAPGS